MPKFGAWKMVDKKKQIPIATTINVSKREIINLISTILSGGRIPNNKTEIMNEIYSRLNNKDFSLFTETKKIDPLAKQLFDKFFKDYEADL